MRILFLGDVVGQDGRRAVLNLLPEWRRRWKVDFAVVNGDNAAHGFGLTGGICSQLFEAGADVVTTGNHTWDQKEICPYLESERRLLRPANYPEGAPGRGCGFYTLPDGRKVGVLHLQGRVYMESLDDPFRAARVWTDAVRLGRDAQAMLIDIHAEATSEKMALGQYCDGRVSLVVGSHTHIPTADAQILPGGTAYMTDAGMCGCFDSVIGMDKAEPVSRFVSGIRRERFSPAKGEPTVCGVLIETDDVTGRAVQVHMIRTGGRLQESLPVL